MKNRLAWIFLLALLLPATAFSETLSKIAVVDWVRIIENFPGGSPALRRIEMLDAEYNQKIEEYLQTLRSKELAVREAEINEDEARILAAKDDLARYQEFIQTYHEYTKAQINREITSVKEGGAVADMIFEAIRFVGINEGYSMIFDVDDRNLLWYSKEVDLTDKVIDQLRLLARRQE